jgi:hypothetical protein
MPRNTSSGADHLVPSTRSRDGVTFAVLWATPAYWRSPQRVEVVSNSSTCTAMLFGEDSRDTISFYSSANDLAVMAGFLSYPSAISVLASAEQRVLPSESERR